jgi:hypothetical protein
MRCRTCGVRVDVISEPCPRCGMDWSSAPRVGPRTIGLDFDNTCVTHVYPDIGAELPLCVSVLKELRERGHRIVLNTMRGGAELEAAVAWMKARGIELHGVNRNPDQHWTDSPKVYAHHYIDDCALGCPVTEKGRVDWVRMRALLVAEGLL